MIKAASKITSMSSFPLKRHFLTSSTVPFVSAPCQGGVTTGGAPGESAATFVGDVSVKFQIIGMPAWFRPFVLQN